MYAPSAARAMNPGYAAVALRRASLLPLPATWCLRSTRAITCVVGVMMSARSIDVLPASGGFDVAQCRILRERVRVDRSASARADSLKRLAAASTIASDRSAPPLLPVGRDLACGGQCGRFTRPPPQPTEEGTLSNGSRR